MDFSSNKEFEEKKTNSYKFIIDKIFSKPIKNNDDKKEYLPTQFITKLIIDEGFGGVKYSSAIRKDGYNICIFEGRNMECVNFEFRKW